MAHLVLADDEGMCVCVSPRVVRTAWIKANRSQSDSDSAVNCLATSRSSGRVGGQTPLGGMHVLQVPAPGEAVGTVIGKGVETNRLERGIEEMGNAVIQKRPEPAHRGDVWFVIEARDTRRRLRTTFDIENLIIGSLGA